MIPSSRGFSRFSSHKSGQTKINSVGERFPINRTLMEVTSIQRVRAQKWLRDLKQYFFLAIPLERVYLIRRGAVRLSRVYESGEEITALYENSYLVFCLF